MRRYHGLLLALALSAAAVSCYDEKPPLQESEPEGETDLGTPDPDSGQPPVVTPDRFLVLIVNPEVIDDEVLSQHNISAHLFDSTGQRLANQPIKFELLGENPGGAMLTAETVNTDDQGKAEVQLSLGDTPTELTVRVSTRSSTVEPQDIPVYVRPRPTGRLHVSLEGVGPTRIAPIWLYVMPGTNRCPYNPVLEPFGQLAQATLEGVEQSTDFEMQQFPSGQTVTIWARGMCGTTMRTICASGCLDGVTIPANDTANVTVTVVVKPLNMVGTFDVTGKYDFTDAIPGTAGDVIRRLDTLFNNTARFLIDGMQDLLELFLGGIIAEVINWVIDQVQPLFEDTINQWILDMAPDWLLDFFQIGRDLLQIVTDLEMLSVIRFDKTGSDFTVAGTEEWIGIALYWRVDCEEDDPPDCGRLEYNMEEMMQAEQPIEAVFATFNARTSNYNRLRMDPHDVNLQYGRLILFVLNEVILPAVADGAHSLTEALINVLDCEGIAWSICGDDGEWGGTYLGVRVGFEVDDVIDWCEGAAGFLGDSASGILEDLAFDSVLTIEGSCDLYEDNRDMMVDRLENGHYSGRINVDGAQGNPFTGDFRGDRRAGSR